MLSLNSNRSFEYKEQGRSYMKINEKGLLRLLIKKFDLKMDGMYIFDQEGVNIDVFKIDETGYIVDIFMLKYGHIHITVEVSLDKRRYMASGIAFVSSTELLDTRSRGYVDLKIMQEAIRLLNIIEYDNAKPLFDLLLEDMDDVSLHQFKLSDMLYNSLHNIKSKKERVI